MRKNLGVKSYLYPMPVLIIASYDEAGKADAMNAAWGSVCDSDKVALYLSHKHKTVKNILARKAFTVSMQMLLTWQKPTMWESFPETIRRIRWRSPVCTP